MSSGHISHVEAERSAVRSRINDAEHFYAVDAELEKLDAFLRERRRLCNSEEAEACFTEIINGIEDLRKESALNTYVSGADL